MGVRTVVVTQARSLSAFKKHSLAVSAGFFDDFVSRANVRLQLLDVFHELDVIDTQGDCAMLGTLV